ncbi:protein huluwa isoform X4 [Alosa alosa]|uniref:protein huluwa isoform X4 n=1 Tax=Alosa alosa TaxID=278164 RepID=UPI0020154698|nr:protein huluwa isoform X4 [Alosa alosa]
MDQPVSATPSVTANIPGLTIVIILLVPCLLLVLLLNCLLLGHKLLLLAGGKTRVRTSSQCSLLQSTRQRVSHFTDGPSFSYPNGRTYGPVSRPILAMPVTSSLTSSQERVAGCLRSTQPDGATCAGSGSLPVPSTLLAATSTTGSAARAGLPRRARAYFSRPVEWRRFPLEPTQSSDSDVERANTVPPNSPAPRCCGPLRQSSTLEVHSDVELGFLNQDPLRAPLWDLDWTATLAQAQVCLCASCLQTVRLWVVDCGHQRWSGITTTPATSHRTSCGLHVHTPPAWLPNSTGSDPLTSTGLEFPLHYK